MKQELLPVTNYLPDVETIRKNGVRVSMADGKMSLDKKRWYVETTQILAEKLGCEMVTFPGHHGFFMGMSIEWAATLRDVLHKAAKEPKLEKRKGTNLNLPHGQALLDWHSLWWYLRLRVGFVQAINHSECMSVRCRSARAAGFKWLILWFSACCYMC